MSRIQLVTFDLDDTLWDLGPVLTRAEQHLYNWLQDNAPAVTARYSATALQELKAEVLAANPELRHQISQMRISTLEHALRASGYPPAQVSELARRGFEVFLHARHDVAYFEYALEMLADLSRHYTLGALTNGNADVQRLSLSRYFDFGLAAEHVRASKPAPELFLAALQRCSVEPYQAVHVGDHVENDVRGAQAVGMHTVWVNFERHPWPGGPPPGATVHSLQELPEAVARLDRR